MKGRESGMPDEAYWNSFFDAESALRLLIPEVRVHGDLIEFGCGYGTFTVPAATRVDGWVTGLDIDPEMTAATSQHAAASGVTNVRVGLRDFVADGTGLPDASQSHAMVYNLLHLEQPIELLREAHRVLQPGGTLSVMHWRSDIDTPRGPSRDIRPRPEQCIAWMEAAGFVDVATVDLAASCPYHFGLVARH